ncbi:MAG: hypothetical protein AAB731_03515 [Patescibacteria group bacterium]
MTLRQYLILMTLCTVLSWVAWVAVLISVDPAEQGILAVLFFYASLGLAVVGTNAIIGLFLRARFNRLELVSRLAATSFRQAIWFAAAVIIALVLERMKVFTWWIMVGIIFALLVLEFFFLSLRRRAE